MRKLRGDATYLVLGGVLGKSVALLRQCCPTLNFDEFLGALSVEARHETLWRLTMPTLNSDEFLGALSSMVEARHATLWRLNMPASMHKRALVEPAPFGSLGQDLIPMLTADRLFMV